MKTLRDSVADEREQRMQSDMELKKLMDDMTAARIGRETTNTLVRSIRRYVQCMHRSYVHTYIHTLPLVSYVFLSILSKILTTSSDPYYFSNLYKYGCIYV